LRITGGKAHIGAVSLSEGSGTRKGKTLKRPHHREAVITEQAIAVLGPRLKGALCCIAGIHYDGLSKAGIQQIVRLSKQGIGQLARRLRVLPL